MLNACGASQHVRRHANGKSWCNNAKGDEPNTHIEKLGRFPLTFAVSSSLCVMEKNRENTIEPFSLVFWRGGSSHKKHGERAKWALIMALLHIFPYFRLLIWAGQGRLIRGLPHNNGSIHLAPTTERGGGRVIKRERYHVLPGMGWIAKGSDGQLKWPPNIWMANYL